MSLNQSDWERRQLRSGVFAVRHACDISFARISEAIPALSFLERTASRSKSRPSLKNAAEEIASGPPWSESIRMRRRSNHGCLPQPGPVALTLSPQEHFHVLCFANREQAVIRQHLAADSAQPVATTVNNRVAGRTVAFVWFDANSGEQILVAGRDGQGLNPDVIIPFRV